MLSASSNPRRGFTLIELLVSVAILLILVMIALQFFSKARTTWETGSRIVDATLKGRSVTDYIAQELSQAVFCGSGVAVAADGRRVTYLSLNQITSVAEFPVVEKEFRYDGAGSVSMSVDSGTPIELCQGLSDLVFSNGPLASNGTPLFVDVWVTVLSADGLNTNKYMSRASFPNRDRYKF